MACCKVSLSVHTPPVFSKTKMRSFPCAGITLYPRPIYVQPCLLHSSRPETSKQSVLEERLANQSQIYLDMSEII